PPAYAVPSENCRASTTMKLNEANKPDNRKFHELPISGRAEYLEQLYQQVYPLDENQRGEFTPAELPSEVFDGKITREQKQEFAATADKLNFLMTRLNMQGDPKLEGMVREVAKLRFEYLFLAEGYTLTQNPELIANFFVKRGKEALVRPVLAMFGEDAIRY